MTQSISKSLLVLSAVSAASCAPALAQGAKTGTSFVDNFDTIDRKTWYISDGWDNGAHQNSRTGEILRHDKIPGVGASRFIGYLMSERLFIRF